MLLLPTAEHAEQCCLLLLLLLLSAAAAAAQKRCLTLQKIFLLSGSFTRSYITTPRDTGSCSRCEAAATYRVLLCQLLLVMYTAMQGAQTHSM
jgi:hypothetical protein